MRRSIRTLSLLSLAALVVVACPALVIAQGCPCVVPDNGFGTADLPPNCPPDGYAGQMQLTDGLPVGTTIEIEAFLYDFVNVVQAPGGTLGGTRETFDASLRLVMTGTGILAGFSRFPTLFVSGETHSGPRTLNDPVQSFPTKIWQLQGQLFGDPDFALFLFEAGDSQNLPSPGHTLLTRPGGGGSPFQVDSFFDMQHTIRWSGAPGSVLQDYGGSQSMQVSRLELCGPVVPVESGISVGTWGRIKRGYR